MWSDLKHFKKEEFIYDPDRMSPDVCLLLDDMREVAQTPFVIHCGWDSSGHVQDSTHYAESGSYCYAVDFHIEGWPLADQWLLAERYPWNGIGLYPFWTHPGLHVDLRRLGTEHPSLGKRWWRDANGTYQALDKLFLKKLLLDSFTKR